MNSVSYKNLNNGKINLTSFDKKIEHSHQNEFRIVIENLNNSKRTRSELYNDSPSFLS